MDRVQAYQIVHALASGVDPFTAENLPGGGALHHPEVIRALFLAAEELEAGGGAAEEAKPPKPKQLPPNAGVSWSEAEDLELTASFEEGNSAKELAALHQRTRGAIHSRLVKLGLIKP